MSSASEVGERPPVGPSRTPLRQSGRARTTPYAHGHSAPTAALQLRPQWLSSARARSPELGAAGGHGQQQRFDASLGAGGHCSGGAAAVRRARWAAASLAATRARLERCHCVTHVQAAVPACSAPLFTLFIVSGGRGLINFETAFERGQMRPSLRRLGRGWFHCAVRQSETRETRVGCVSMAYDLILCHLSHSHPATT